MYFISDYNLATSHVKAIALIGFFAMQNAYAEPSRPKTTKEPRQVTSCGISFQLPRHLKITAPKEPSTRMA